MLERDTETVVVANGDELELTRNPAGMNGWLIEVYVAWTEDDMTLTWDTDGTSLDSANYNVVEVR